MQQDTPLLAQRNRTRGFTLVELIVVMAIIAIVTTIAVPRLGNSLAGLRVERAAQRIVNDLALAQRHARASSASQTVEFDCGDDAYALPGLRDIDHSTAEYQVNLSESPYNATIVSADLGGDSGIVYDGYGQPDSGGTVVIQVADLTVTVTVDAETGQAEASEVQLLGVEDALPEALS